VPVTLHKVLSSEVQKLFAYFLKNNFRSTINKKIIE